MASYKIRVDGVELSLTQNDYYKFIDAVDEIKALCGIYGLSDDVRERALAELLRNTVSKTNDTPAFDIVGFLGVGGLEWLDRYGSL